MVDPGAAVMTIPNLGAFQQMIYNKDWTGIAKWHAVNTPWLNDDQVSECLKYYQMKVRDEDGYQEEIREKFKQLQIQKRDERRKK